MFGEASGQREASGSLSPLRDSQCGWRVERGGCMVGGGRAAEGGRPHVGREGRDRTGLCV